jgi:hypothetical protein
LNILDQYVTSAPSAQNALDILAGAWVSRLPGPLAGLQAGTVELFEDARISWAAEQLGDFKDRTVLELGSLEGGHTYQIDRCRAAAILAVEANTSAYLRSLIVKELLGIRRARFVCGDFLAYLRDNTKRFDVCFASGVLYHMRNPAELIALIARTTDRLFLWTHYYDYVILSQRPDFEARFPDIPPQPAEYQGFQYMLHRQQYQTELHWPGFLGGNAPYSHWMSRDDILACLRYFGFDDLRISFDDPDHGGGPGLGVAAIRTRPNGALDEAEAISPQEILVDDVEATIRSQNQQIASLETRLQFQDQYVATLEAQIQGKNQHIINLEALIKQIEAGLVMQLLRLFR